jgi:hypothetical protein
MFTLEDIFDSFEEVEIIKKYIEESKPMVVKNHDYEPETPLVNTKSIIEND